MKLCAPTATAVAPASKNSIASSALAIPPIPMIGMFTAFATCHTIRSATGFTAGPERPPVILPSNGFLVLISIAIPVNVLIMEIASAPASSTAFAICTISVTFGESFTITVFLV